MAGTGMGQQRRKGHVPWKDQLGAMQESTKRTVLQNPTITQAVLEGLCSAWGGEYPVAGLSS